MLFGKYINKYYRKHFFRLFCGVIALLAVDYFQLIVPELYRKLVNGITGTSPFTMDILLDGICMPMLGVILVMVTGRFAWRICFIGSGIKMASDLRAVMFAHCETLSQQFYSNTKTGTLMSLFTNDIESVQDSFAWGIMMVFDASLLGAMAIYKMFRMNVLLTVFSLIPMGLLMAIGTVVGKNMERKWDERQAVFSELSDFAQEDFSGISVIKAFVKEFSELYAFRKLNRKNEDANVAFAKASAILHILVTLFVETVICVILGYGGYLVYMKSFDGGMLVEFIGYFTAIVWPVTAVAELIDMTSRGKASLERISGLLDSEPDVTDGSGVCDPGELSGDISFRNLTFAYPGTQTNVLDGVSFDIRAGENVGIFGRTGSGKTTLVDLILRIYNVPDGTLFVDGRDVNTIPIRTIRRCAAYVPQDNFLFSDTVENNISFASDTDDPELVVESARLSGVHDDISGFSKGYESVLGERGVTVSGGQKQRISIARALMKKAPILILDDSVSAVDIDTERTILENLRRERRGMTTLVIAHRVSTIEHMDKIIFLDDGRVVAAGSHEELYRSCEPYREAVELQKMNDAREERQ